MTPTNDLDRRAIIKLGAGAAAVAGMTVDLMVSEASANPRPPVNEPALGEPSAHLGDLDRASSIRLLDEVHTPVLVLHGEQHTRVPVTLGLEFYRGLKLLGKPAEMVRYPREPHWFHEPEHQADIQRRVLAWFNAHLQDRLMDDALDPDIRIFTDILRQDWSRYPSLDTVSTVEARLIAELVRARWTAGGPVMNETRNIQVETGAGGLGLRIHRPVGVALDNAPALLYIHGGGFVFFSLDTHDRLMREYADAGEFVVIGIDYPLSPEAKYPDALDRIVALVDWLGEHAAELAIDATRLAIGGDSAGANLALATCMKLRDATGHSAIRGILSNYGAFSSDVSDAAEAAYGGPDALLTQADMVYFFDHYLVSGDQRDDPYSCPLSATDVGGLPPILLVIPELDVLAEQSFALEARLQAAGCAVARNVYLGATHSFLEAMSIAPLAQQAIRDGASWIRKRLVSRVPK